MVRSGARRLPALALALAAAAAACPQGAVAGGALPARGPHGAEGRGLECRAGAPGHEAIDEAALSDTSLLQTGLERSSAPVGGVAPPAPRGPAEAGAPAAAGLSLLHAARAAAAGGTGLGRGSLRLLAGGLGGAGSGGSLHLVWLVVAVIVIAVAIMLLLIAQPSEEGPPGGELLDPPQTMTASLHSKAQLPPFAPPRPSALSRPSALPGPHLGSADLPPTSGVPTAPRVVPHPAEGPPPICASLILPNTEARFMISMESLLSITTGTLDVLGTSGRKLLSASVDDLPDGSRSLSLASDGCESDPRAVISAPAAPAAEPTRSLLVFGRGGRAYGSVEATNSGGALLHYQGLPVLSLEPGPAADLAMTALSTDGRVLAVAGRNVGGRRRSEDIFYWRLHVKPGTDAVLITCCMLATLLLVPSPSRLSLPSLQSRPSERSMPPSMLPSVPRISTPGAPNQ